MAATRSSIRRLPQKLAGPAALILLVVTIMHASLFSAGKLVPTRGDTDLHLQFLGWRYFAFTQWLHGHFPFWNPHVFSGIPFFAQFQSNLLYPITWINFLLNAGAATTIELAANICAAALCTYFWARLRGISRCGATLAGIVFAFSGPIYLRVLAGHLSPLASVAWTPLLFAAVDLLLSDHLLAGMLMGSIGVCLQWLGGYPQYGYYGLLIAGLYLLIFSIDRPRFWNKCGAFLAMCVLGSALAAAQIIPGLRANQLSIRAGGGSYQFVATCSLPWENLLSIFIPYPLGDMTHAAYMGRWYFWETSIYAGIVNLALAVIAVAHMNQRRRWQTIAILAAVLILALGYYTGVHWWLYQYLPGFSLFRGASKFGAIWVLLLAVLAGEGFDIARQRTLPRQAAVILGVALICVSIGVMFLEFQSASGPEGRLLTRIYRSSEYLNERLFHQPHLVPRMARWMAWQWFIASALLLAMAALLHLRRWFAWAPYVLLIIAGAEIYLAAWESAAISPAMISYPAEWVEAARSAMVADQRVLFADSVDYSNLGNLTGVDSLWGYDPAQPSRYTDLIAASQNEHPAMREAYYPSFSKASRIFQLLRCRYILQSNPRQPVIELPDPMPHLQLLGRYVRMNDPQAMAAALAHDFDFHHVAILERDPSPPPTSAGAAGQVRLLRQTINDLEIEANLSAPALLLITDAYAPGWRVRAIETNANQSQYEVLRADDVLRAIPLAAGRHHFDLYYTPPGLWAGVCISALGLALFLPLGWWRFRTAR